MTTIITDELIEKAARAVWGYKVGNSSFDGMKGALLAVLPDIERAVREECARMADDRAKASDWTDERIGLINLGLAIRSLPPSTQETK
jgi:hypothetical protein